MKGKEMIDKAIMHFNELFKELATKDPKIRVEDFLLKLVTLEEVTLSDGEKVLRGIATSPRFVLVVNYLVSEKAGVAYLHNSLTMELVGRMIFGECSLSQKPSVELN